MPQNLYFVSFNSGFLVEKHGLGFIHKMYSLVLIVSQMIIDCLRIFFDFV